VTFTHTTADRSVPVSSARSQSDALDTVTVVETGLPEARQRCRAAA
jgi:hypothetical protein